MKKIISFVLCLIMVLSMGIMGISAEEVKDTTPVDSEQIIWFDAKSGDINLDTKQIYCHIWEIGGDSFAAWQSKREKCTLVDSKDGLWKYNISSYGFQLETGVEYGVIFSSFEGLMTYDVLMDTTCLGDTLENKGEGATIVAPTDSMKRLYSVYWKNADPAECGPIKTITTLGYVEGCCLPEGVTEEDLYKDFINSGYYYYAAQDRGETVEELLSLTAEELGISEDRAYELQLEAGLHKPVTRDELPVDPQETTIPAETETSEVATLAPQPETTSVINGDTETEPVFPTDPEETEPIETTVAQDSDTNRYYFYMPDYWTDNDYATTAGIYWWEGTDFCKEWPGYEAKKADAEGIYYYDVPKDVCVIIWNNYVDGGFDPTLEIYNAAQQTRHVDTQYYYPEENPLYPEGLESFDNMIFVCDLSSPYGSFEGKKALEGEWYYYYGNGEYGIAKNKADADHVFTDSLLFEPGVEIKKDDDILPYYNPGDVNMDSKLNIKDATLIQKYVAKLVELDEVQQLLADFDVNGNINVKDATGVQKKVAGLI